MTLNAGPEPQYALLHSSSQTAYQSDMLPVRFSREDSDAKVLCKGVTDAGSKRRAYLGGKLHASRRLTLPMVKTDRSRPVITAVGSRPPTSVCPPALLSIGLSRLEVPIAMVADVLVLLRDPLPTVSRSGENLKKMPEGTKTGQLGYYPILARVSSNQSYNGNQCKTT